MMNNLSDLFRFSMRTDIDCLLILIMIFFFLSFLSYVFSCCAFVSMYVLTTALSFQVKSPSSCTIPISRRISHCTTIRFHLFMYDPHIAILRLRAALIVSLVFLMDSCLDIYLFIYTVLLLHDRGFWNVHISITLYVFLPMFGIFCVGRDD